MVMTATLELLAEDKQLVVYRPRLAALVDSVLSAILLQSILHYWKTKGQQPFYKFKEPCANTAYREGDSWCETLEWNRSEFDTALRPIGTKVEQGKSKKEILATEYPERKAGESAKDYAKRFAEAMKCLVVYWTDSNRITWYQINETLLDKAVNQIYLNKEQSLRYLSKAESRDSQIKQKSALLGKAESRDTYVKQNPALLNVLGVDTPKDSELTTESTQKENTLRAKRADASPSVVVQEPIPPAPVAAPIQEKPSIPEATKAPAAEMPKLVEPKKPNLYEFAAGFAWANEGLGKAMLGQLLGTAKKGERADYKLDPPATPEEIMGWHFWHKHKYGAEEWKKFLPRAAEKVKLSWEEYRADTRWYQIAVDRGASELEKQFAPVEPVVEPVEKERATPEQRAYYAEQISNWLKQGKRAS